MLKSMFSFLHQDISGRNVDGTGPSEVSEVVLVDFDPTQDYDPDLYKCEFINYSFCSIFPFILNLL